LGFALEREAEAQLHRARRVRQVRARLRLQERAAGLRQVVSAVVLPVEQVEHFEAAREGRLAVQRDPLQETHLDAVDRLADEALAGDDAAVWALRIVHTQTIDARDLQPSRIAAAHDLAA